MKDIYWQCYPLSLITFALHFSSVIGESESLQGPVSLSPTTSGSRSNLQNGGSTATSMPTDEANNFKLYGLPKVTLHCSSLDRLRATVDWEGSNVNLTPVYIEVACLDMENNTKTYYATLFRNVERLRMVAELLSDPPTLYYVTPTTTNMYTAAVWHEEMKGLVGKTETTGPYFTTCDLHPSDTISRPSVILDTIWSSMVTADELANTLLTISSSDPTDLKTRFDAMPTYPPDHPDSSRAILGAAVSVGILLLIILGLIMIISIMLVKQRRKIVPGQIVSFGNEVDNQNTQVKILQYPDTDDAQQYDDN